MHRDPDSLSVARKASGLIWRRGDAMVASDVAAAAHDASVILHAVNPPGYRNWGKLVLPMLDNTIAAGGANGARIVLPGTIYNFGPDAFPEVPWPETLLVAPPWEGGDGRASNEPPRRPHPKADAGVEASAGVRS